MNWFSMFFGLLFILFGISMILKAFGIYLPIPRVFAALFIIAIGVKILLPRSFSGHRNWGATDGNSVAFSESSTEYTGGSHAEYNAAFGGQKIDLTKVDLSKGNIHISINVAFGSSEVRIDPKTPVKIVANSVLGSVEMPGGNSAFFGTNTYKSDNYKEDSQALLIDVNAAFGSIKIK